MTPQVHDALRRRVYDPHRRQIHPTPPEGCQEDLRCSLRPAGADPCSLWLCRDGSSMSTRAQHQWSNAFLKSPLWQLKAFTPSRRRSVFLVAEENSMKQGMQKQLRH